MKDKNGEHPWGDTGQLVLLIVFLVVWTVDSFFLKATTFIAGHVHPAVRIALSAAFMTVAVLLVRAGHAAVHEAEGARGLLREGAFRYIRHPLYMGCRLFYLSLFHLTFSMAALVVMITAFVFYDRIAAYEEKLLLRRFGGEYEEYMRRTGRWYPRLRGRGRRPGT